MKLKIRKGDSVQVIAGADKGKKGTVVQVNPSQMKIKIEGVRVQTHYDKKEGFLKKEGFVDYSNVKLLQAATTSKAKPKAKKSASKSKA